MTGGNQEREAVGGYDRATDNPSSDKFHASYRPCDEGTTYDKVPKFRKLEVEEDVEAYFGAYEAHMDSYGVP